MALHLPMRLYNTPELSFATATKRTEFQNWHSNMPCLNPNLLHGCNNTMQRFQTKSTISSPPCLPLMVRPSTTSSPVPVVRASTGRPRNKKGVCRNSALVPGPLDVVCARGREAWNHPGNKNLRAAVDEASPMYSQAKSKMERTAIVSRIVKEVRNRGNFLKHDTKTGLWKDVGDALARAKVGNLLRNTLSEKYRSSAQAKIRRKRESCAQVHQNLNSILHSNREVSYIMNQLTKDVLGNEDQLTDEQAMEIFNQANMQLLASVKKDTSLVVRFHVAATSVLSSSSLGDCWSDDDSLSVWSDDGATAASQMMIE